MENLFKSGDLVFDELLYLFGKVISQVGDMVEVLVSSSEGEYVYLIPVERLGRERDKNDEETENKSS